MIKRKTIAILFVFDYDRVTGVVIYLLNIIRTLKQLPDERRPNLLIIYSKNSPLHDVKSIAYPYCSFYEYEKLNRQLSILDRVVNKISRFLFSKNLLKTFELRNALPSDVEAIYPYFPLDGLETIKKKIYWKADFQEKYYPQFFSKDELKDSDSFMRSISSLENLLVLSSNDAFNDFRKYYPRSANPVKLLRFTSNLPDLEDVNLTAIKERLNISKRYFFIANQFWPHKNHITVLKAIKKLRDRLDCQFVFSGKTTNYRDEDYFPSLKQFVKDNDLEDFVNIVGFIDRKEQLALMRDSLAVIQPSLFEGWSTVIEDAKALNKFVIASNLRVNIEQVKENCTFFQSEDENQLAEKIIEVWENKHQTVIFNYQESLGQFQRDICNTFGL